MSTELQTFAGLSDDAKRRGISILALMREGGTLPADRVTEKVQAFGRIFGLELPAEDVERLIEAVAPVVRELGST